MANNTSISNLNEVEEVNSGDFFLIDTPNGTQKIDFGNVLIPLDNATFNTTISAHADDILQNRTEIQTLTSALYNGVNQNLKLNSVNVLTQLSAVSADVNTIEVADFENSVVGSVLQTVYFRTNEHMVIAHEDNLMYSLSALSASITPKADNSVFLLICRAHHEHSGGNNFGFGFRRDTGAGYSNPTYIDGLEDNHTDGDPLRAQYMFGGGASMGDHLSTPTESYLIHIDAPSVSKGTSVTYHPFIQSEYTSSALFYLNRSANASNTYAYEDGESSFIIMELAAGTFTATQIVSTGP